MVRNIPVLLLSYLEQYASIPHFIAIRQRYNLIEAAEQGNKNGCIVTDFIMILLLLSIYEDDNGIESPDTLPTTKTFLLYSVPNLVYVPLLSPDSLRHAVIRGSIRNTATNADDYKI